MTTPEPDPDIPRRARYVHSSSPPKPRAGAREDSATTQIVPQSASHTDVTPYSDALTANHVAQDAVAPGGETQVDRPREHGGQTGPEPTRYGDWEKKGRCTDF